MTTAARPYLSVVIPAYNEAKRIGASVRRVLDYLRARPYTWEFIVVDDGSQDETVAVIKEAGGDDVRVVSYQPNRGKGGALQVGMLEAAGEIIVFSDADLSTPIEQIETFLPCFEQGYEIVIGSRKMRGAEIAVRQPLMRRLGGKAFTALSNLILGVRVSDATCGFKAWTRRAAREVFSRQTISGWGFDSEDLLIAHRLGFRIKEIPVRWADNAASRVSLLRDTVRSFSELVRIRLKAWRGEYGEKRERSADDSQS
jgi:glycosyltransferase involved in cell wall biosynthesis